MKELWKDVEGYEGFYRISSDGNVLSLQYGKAKRYKKKAEARLLKPHKNNMGYKFVNLYNREGKGCRRFLIHRLVAKAFIPNPDNLPFVDHIDTNPLNNCVENLRWVDAKGNSNNPITLMHLKEGCKNNGCPPHLLERAHEASRKPVVMIDKKDYSELRTFKSITEAQNETGIAEQSISFVCNGKRKSAGGYIWKYKTKIFGT